MNQTSADRARDTLIQQIGEIMADLCTFDREMKLRQGYPFGWDDPLLQNIRDSEKALSNLRQILSMCEYRYL